MRKIKITMAMAAGAILFVLSSCGQIEKPEEGTKVGSGIEKIVESDEEPQAAQNTKTTGNSEAHTGLDNDDSAAHAAGEEKAGTTKQAEKEDVTGIYTDKQGTSDVYRELVLALQEDGTYAAEIGIYRATELKGTEVWEGDTLRFTSDDSYPYVLADIFVTGSQAEVAFTKADVLGIQAGDVYSFPDGAPNESVAGQDGNAAFQPSLSDEIAAEISYAEEREKEITEKQKAADTQMDMNITAAEMYQMWDDTLNIVWELLEANLNEVDMEVLRKEEKEWIAFKDAEVQAAGQECEGGSIQPSVEASRAADLTKARVYELAEYAK